jgi:hypothetical protein
MHIPIKSGALIPLLIMLPNLVWFLVPHPPSGDNASVPMILNIAENAGRIAILVIPFFYSLSFGRRFSTAALVVACLALALYYAAWTRYFAGGQTATLMSASLIGIPMPLALAPVVLLLASAYLLGSWPMLAASVWFGIAHIWVSALTL